MLKDDQKVWDSNEKNRRTLAENLANSHGQLPSAIDACYDRDWVETLKIVRSGKLDAICD